VLAHALVNKLLLKWCGWSAAAVLTVVGAELV
jgi:hypothetical protein